MATQEQDNCGTYQDGKQNHHSMWPFMSGNRIDDYTTRHYRSSVLCVRKDYLVKLMSLQLRQTWWNLIKNALFVQWLNGKGEQDHLGQVWTLRTIGSRWSMKYQGSMQSIHRGVSQASLHWWSWMLVMFWYFWWSARRKLVSVCSSRHNPATYMIQWKTATIFSIVFYFRWHGHSL